MVKFPVYFEGQGLSGLLCLFYQIAPQSSDEWYGDLWDSSAHSSPEALWAKGQRIFLLLEPELNGLKAGQTDFFSLPGPGSGDFTTHPAGAWGCLYRLSSSGSYEGLGLFIPGGLGLGQ